MSQRDRDFYAKLKADEERYKAYLERKRKERAARGPAYEANRKGRWRKKHPEVAKLERMGSHAVQAAKKSKAIIPPEEHRCPNCGRELKPQAYHYLGYAERNRTEVEWLCYFCIAKRQTKKNKTKSFSLPSNCI